MRRDVGTALELVAQATWRGRTSGRSPTRPSGGPSGTAGSHGISFRPVARSRRPGLAESKPSRLTASIRTSWAGVTDPVGVLTWQRRRSCRGRRTPSSTAAVSAASEPCTALASMLSAKSARMVPFSAFLRIGRAHQVTVLQDGAFTLQGLDHHGTADHEVDQVVEERAGLVDGVEAVRLHRATDAPSWRRRPSGRRASKRA